MSPPSRGSVRAGFFPRYIRVFVMLAALLLGALAVGALTVAVTALPHLAGAERAVAALGSALVIFGVLLLGARLLLCRPAPFRALWPAAALGAVTVTLVLNLGPLLLARLVSKAGAVYGSFATVAGMFALLYLVSQALVYSAEVAAVRYARLWPRALDVNRPTAADVRAMALLAREQERIRAARVTLRLVSPDPPPAGGDPPPSPALTRLPGIARSRRGREPHRARRPGPPPGRSLTLTAEAPGTPGLLDALFRASAPSAMSSRPG